MFNLRGIWRPLVIIYLVLFLCLTEGSRISIRQTKHFLCDDNSVIDSILICNGQLDCPDGSDETSICQKEVCNADQVKCDYGACVKDLSNCYRNTPQSSEFQSTFCINANILRNGNIWKLSNSRVRVSLNDIVENFAQIEYECIDNHYIVGNSTNLCDNGKWLNRAPKCEPRCSPAIIDNITFSAQCFVRSNDGRENEVRCSDLAIPGTVVRFNCKRGYERLNSHVQLSTCDESGRWSPLPSLCTQYCGEEAPEGTSYIVGGVEADIKKVPWHVGIYYKVGTELMQQCGGTIISSKVVVSAAHCFWDVNKNELKPESNYRIVAGKHFRDINDPRENNTFQSLGLQKIHILPAYSDYLGLYADDIAVLVLANFIEYKRNVGPICIENYKYEDKAVPVGSIGRVAGWGLTESSGISSDKLKQIDLPVVQRQKCLEEFEQNFRPFVTSDKFCAGYLSGVGVCRGDSGGGLVFPKIVNGKTLYYLRGIVSTGPNKLGSCDNDKYALFTNAAHFFEFIENHEIANRPTLAISVGKIDTTASNTKNQSIQLTESPYIRLSESMESSNINFVGNSENYKAVSKATSDSTSESYSYEIPSEAHFRSAPSLASTSKASISKIEEPSIQHALACEHSTLSDATLSAQVVACENSFLNIGCKPGHVISVLDAKYGRLSTTICKACDTFSEINKLLFSLTIPNRNLDCLSSYSYGIVRMQCHGKQDCSVLATNGLFGDPCIGSYKCLTVDYECTPNNCT